MSLKSPISYADWYWKHSVDAQKEFSETIESAMSPQFAALFAEIEGFSEIPDSIQRFLKPLSEPHAAGLDQYLTAAGGELAAEVMKDFLSPVLTLIKRSVNKIHKTNWLTSVQAATLRQREWIGDDTFYFTTQTEGYDDKVADFIYEAQQPYPSIPDIMLWARYNAGIGDDETLAKTKFDISTRDYELWKWQTLQRLTTVQAQSLNKRGELIGADYSTELFRIGWSTENIGHIKDLAYILPNSMLMVQGGLIQGISDENILKNISKGDIHPDYAKTYLDAVLTKPASIDLMSYWLRKDPSLSTLEQELKKIGIHPKYTGVYKTLAYQIPPVADIITMAVREAFSPTIAAKFGQYQDFPADLKKYAGQKGLSEEWAKRYWAAHWALPSPQQGFEMLHRGVIENTELDMLLRAQDVMPFWREKLTAIAYRPLTRVDVRRMYKQGVLNEREVFESYQDQGYDDENAERMAEFTVRQTLASLSKFTSSDIIKAFSNRMIDRSTAISLLRDIDIRPEDANYIVSTAEYKRQWAFMDDQIAGIRNLYKKRIYDINQASDKLARLNLPADQINVLMEQWYYEKIEELDATWTTGQTLKFLKRKLITVARARQELYLNGYTKERVDIYLRDAQWTPPKE